MTRPMKGTAARGKTLAEDSGIEEWLRNDVKSRAENIMIVDLLRNDMARICKFGSVKVTERFKVEKYRSLFQMVSAVEGDLREGIRYQNIFEALFPSGSVTGAPKIRAMQLIDELESEPRGVYTGAVGFFSPENEAMFNVAIRTIVINESGAHMGSGSGIVWDSDAEQEYSECLLKGTFLSSTEDDFSLIETLLWQRNGYSFLEAHLDRLANSALYFDYPYNRSKLSQQLCKESQNFNPNHRYKVRILLNSQGKCSVQSLKLEERPSQSNRIALCSIRVDSENRFSISQNHLSRVIS